LSGASARASTPAAGSMPRLAPPGASARRRVARRSSLVLPKSLEQIAVTGVGRAWADTYGERPRRPAGCPGGACASGSRAGSRDRRPPTTATTRPREERLPGPARRRPSGRRRRRSGTGSSGGSRAERRSRCWRSRGRCGRGRRRSACV
jgi:hypothetical protein